MQTSQNETVSVWSKNLVLAIVASACVGLAGQMLNPTLPLYAVELGISESLAGVAIAAFSVGSLVTRPFAGLLVDRYGRRRIIFIGAVLFLVAFSSYLFTAGFVMMMFIRVLQGIASCFTTTGISTIATDVIPRQRISEGIGYYALAGAVSMTIGPAIGLKMQELFSMQAIFILGLFLGGGCILVVRNIHYTEQLIKREPGKKEKIRLYEKSSLLPAAMIFIVTISQTALTAFLALYGKSIGLEGVSNFFLFTSVGTISARAFAGRVTNRFGEMNVLVVAMIVTACCQFAVALVTSTAALICIALIYGFSYGILYPVTNALSVKHARPENRGGANATYTASFDFGAIIGGVIWGGVAAVTGYRVMYMLAAALVLTAIFLIPVYKKQYPEEYGAQ